MIRLSLQCTALWCCLFEHCPKRDNGSKTKARRLDTEHFGITSLLEKNYGNTPYISSQSFHYLATGKMSQI